MFHLVGELELGTWFQNKGAIGWRQRWGVPSPTGLTHLLNYLIQRAAKLESLRIIDVSAFMALIDRFLSKGNTRDVWNRQENGIQAKTRSAMILLCGRAAPRTTLLSLALISYHFIRVNMLIVIWRRWLNHRMDEKDLREKIVLNSWV